MERILIISFPSGLGGTERFVMNLAECLDKDRFVLDLIYYHGIHPLCREFFVQRGGKLYEMPDYTKNPIKFIHQIIKFYKEHKEYRIIYHQANTATSILYSFPVWFNRKKYILYHSHNSYSTKMALHKTLSKIIAFRCEYVFACSETAGRFMYGKLKFQIIKNAINLENYRYDEEKRKNMRRNCGIGDEIVIGNVSGLREQKNHSFLIDVFFEFLKIYPDAKLVLVGDGELRRQIECKVSDYGIENNVILTGNVNNAEEYYQMFDAFVMPSFYEGLPFAAVEAQASGTFCLLSNRVDTSIKLTPLIHFFDLYKPAADWARFLASNVSDFKKKDYINDLEDAGFGLKNMSCFYNSLFEKLAEGKNVDD